MKSFAFICLIITLSIPVSSVAGDVIPPAYRQTGVEYGIPPVILYSIALTESGKSFRGQRLPWPWTVNHGGKGLYFPSRRAAYDYLSQVLKGGEKNFDVGLMQINWRWNAGVFDSLWESLDPYANLRGGASILQSHYVRLGSFEGAVGAYHSPGNATRASAYRERVRSAMAGVLQQGERF